MECPSCGFQNIPGIKACVRCQSGLMFDDVLVEPPRARGPRWLRWVFRGAAQLNASFAAGVEGLLGLGRRALRLNPLEGDAIDWGAIRWSLIPGFGHLRRGWPRLGRGIFIGWLVAIGLSIMFLGTSTGAFFSFGAVILHTLAVGHFLGRAFRYDNVLSRLFIGMMLFVILTALLYRPVEWAVNSAVAWTEVHGIYARGALENDDVILYSGWLMRPERYERGDIVLYRIPADRAPGVIVREGYGVDRIVGLPGDTVTVKDGRVHVNGGALPESHQPLGRVGVVNGFTTTAGPGQYIILPSQSTFMIQGGGARYFVSVMQQVAHVEHGEVMGRVLWRLHPWSRSGPIEVNK